MSQPTPPPCPKGASHFGFNVLAATLALVCLFALRAYTDWPAHRVGLVVITVLGVLIGLHELLILKAHRLPSSGLNFDQAFAPRLQRVFYKLLGLSLTLGIIAAVYWLLPEYHGSFYQPFWDTLRTWGLVLLAISPLYFWYIDGRQVAPEDAYYHLGRALLRRSPEGLGTLLRPHFMGWAVKGFFLPLMTVYISQEVQGSWDALAQVQRVAASAGGFWAAFTTKQMGFYPYELLYHLGFTIDLLFCVLGYAMTLRLVDGHIRSTEPTALGWLVALACYQPFFSLLENAYLRYEDGIVWGTWLYGLDVMKFVWALAILVLLSVYAFSTVAFGLRFSNLTYRGIITSGPYRWSKHPAYLSKNLSWWLISVPFIAMSSSEALRNCAHLLLINGLYYLRAKTEEAHLSQDPLYREYAAWIAQHGLIAKLKRGLGWRTA